MKTASIKTNMFYDPFFQKLTERQKLIWVYLLNNDHMNIAGVYEIGIMTISSGVSRECTDEDVEEAFKVFEKENKAFYRNNYIILANRIKNTYNANNDGINKGVLNILETIPQEIFDFAGKTDTRIGHLIKKVGHLIKRTGDTPILSYINSIQSYPIQNKSNQSNPKPAKNDRQGWTDGFSLIFDGIKERYGLNAKDLQKLYAIADSEPGRQMINEIWKKIELKGDIEKKGNYLMTAIRKNSMKSEL